MNTICLRLVAFAAFLLLLPNTSFQTVSETDLYVKPTSDSLCPTEPCFTLSQCQQLVKLHLTNHTTLHFLPGDHILDSSLTIQNVIKFSLFGQLSGIECKIICKGAVGLSFHNVSSLQIGTLAFKNCGKVAIGSQCGPITSALFVNLVQLFTLTDITFQSCLGSAVVICKSITFLRGNNSFVRKFVKNNNNCSGIYAYKSNITISGHSTFRGHSFSGSGGAISTLNSILNITADTVFDTNVAHDGGAIYADSSTLTVSGNSVFKHNSAVNNGGAVYLYNTSVKFTGNSTFYDNSAIKGRGGGLHSKSSILKIYGDTNFSGNSAVYGGGLSLVYSILECNRSSTFP